MKTLYRLTALAAATLVSSASFAAGTATCSSSPCQQTMGVTASVIAACTSLTTTDIAFGSAVAPATGTTVSNATSTITANCSSGTLYTIELDYGLNAVTGSTQRRVEDGSGNFLDYKIFKPTAAGAASTTSGEWGTNASQAGSGFQLTGNGANQALTASGVLTRVPGSPVGSYTDEVTVKLSY